MRIYEITTIHHVWGIATFLFFKHPFPFVLVISNSWSSSVLWSLPWLAPGFPWIRIIWHPNAAVPGLSFEEKVRKEISLGKQVGDISWACLSSQKVRSGPVRSGPGLTQQSKERKKERKYARGMGWKINRKGVLHVSMWIEGFKVVDGLTEGNLLCMAGRMQGLPEQINGEAGMLQRGSKQPRPLEDGNWVCDDPSCTNVNYPRRTEVRSVLSSSSWFISLV